MGVFFRFFIGSIFDDDIMSKNYLCLGFLGGSCCGEVLFLVVVVFVGEI